MNELYLIGKSCSLREFREEDLELLRQWYNDKTVTRFLFRGAFPYNEESERAQNINYSRNSEVVFAVVAADGTTVGIAGIHCLNWLARNGEFRVLLGNKDYWGKGIGTEVLQLITAYGFEVLNLEKVSLGVNEENVAAYKTYQKCNFTIEGTLRHEVYRAGQYFDVVKMSILKNEYYEAVKSWKLQDEIRAMYPL